MNLQKTILAAAAILMAVFILTLTPSCSYQKDLHKTETSTKAESRTEDSLKIESLRRDTAEYLRQLREREYFEAQMDCPELDTAAIKEGFAGYVPLSVVDSIVKANTRPIRTTTVEKGADGSVKITGNNIRHVRYIKEKDEKEISRYTSTIQTLLEQQIKTAASLVSTTKEKEKHSKGGFLNFPWLWFILILLVGIYLGWRLRGAIKLIDKLNNYNMKNVILILLCSLLMVSCGKSPKPDNVIYNTDVEHKGWDIVDKYTDPVPHYDTTYYLKPTWGQSNDFASQRGDHGTWNVIGFILIGLGVFWFIGIGTDLIRWFPSTDAKAKGIGSLAILAAIGMAFSWQVMNVKWRNKHGINKQRYDSIMKHDGSTRAFWDSLNNGCHIVGGKYGCWDKDNKRIK